MANFTESRPAFVKDVTGRENIVYQDASSALIHARYDSNAQEWVDAQALPYGNQPAFNLKLLSADKIVPTGNASDPLAPGLVLLWQEKADNNADLYYSVGRYDNTGDVVWSDAVQIETDVDGQPVADLNFDAAIIKDNNGNPEIVIVEQRLNPDTTDPNTGIPSEDADLYYITLNPKKLDLVFETPPAPIAEVERPGPTAQLPFVEVPDDEAVPADVVSAESSELKTTITLPTMVTPDGTVINNETIAAALAEQLSELSDVDSKAFQQLQTGFETGFTYSASLGEDGKLEIGTGFAGECKSLFEPWRDTGKT